MKLKVEKSNVLRMLKHCSKESGSHVTMDDHLALEAEENADGGQVRFTVSNESTQLMLRAEAPGEVESAGVVHVQAASFAQTIESMSGKDPIQIQEKGTRLLVQQGSRKARLPTMDDRETPTERAADEPIRGAVEVQAGHLVSILTIAERCSGRDEDRRNLYGVQLENGQSPEGETKLVAVATDGHRAAWAACPVVSTSGSIRDLVDPKMIQTLVRIVQEMKDEESVFLTFQGPKIVVRANGYEAQRALPEGEGLPQYEKVVPKGKPTAAAQMDASVLLDLTDFALRYTDDSRMAKIDIDPEKGQVRIQSQSHHGSGNHSEDLEGIDGQAEGIAINCKFLNEAAQNAAAQEGVEIQFYGKEKPMKIVPVPPKEEAEQDPEQKGRVDWWSIIMLMRA